MEQGARPNARCPHCGSLERQRLLWLFLQGLSKKRHFTVLHIAPFIPLLQNIRAMTNIEVISVDVRKYKGLDFVMDLEYLTCASDTFDIVICSHVLEHVKDDDVALTEIFRVLRHDGVLLLQLPPLIDHTIERENATEDEKANLLVQNDHLRRHGKDLISRLTSLGFYVTMYENENSEFNTSGEIIQCIKMNCKIIAT